MPIDWLDVSTLSFQNLLLFERVQISWLPGWNFPEPELCLALAGNPAVAWYLKTKCPEVAAWVEAELARAELEWAVRPLDPVELRRAEVSVLARLVDLLVYAVDPAVYDRLPFLGWDSAELTGLVDFGGERVLDIGAGTGRLAFAVTGLAETVWAVEPVASLRDYLRAKAAGLGFKNFYAVDGTLTTIPFPDGFAGITMGGHVFGDNPPAEHAELLRVTRQGGMVILCPGSSRAEGAAHRFLIDQGYNWAEFIEPPADAVCKYWLVKQA